MGVSTGLHPLKRDYAVTIPATAQGATAEFVAVRAPFTGSVVDARYIPVAAITGANTNTRRIGIRNRGAAGAGTVEAAARQYDTGTNGVAWAAGSATLAATVANRDFVEGDVLTVRSEAIGTGLADPGGTVILTLARD